MTGMMPSPRLAAALLVTFAALGGLSGCSSDEADVCATVDSLSASVDNLKNVNPGENALAEVEKNLTLIKEDLGDLRDEAKEQYSSEITVVTDAVDDLEEALRIARDLPSAKTFKPIVTSVAAAADGLTALGQAVSDSC
jgi:hypothetical protein